MKGDIEAPLTELKKCILLVVIVTNWGVKIQKYIISIFKTIIILRGRFQKKKTKKLVELLTEGVLGQCVS